MYFRHKQMEFCGHCGFEVSKKKMREHHHNNQPICSGAVGYNEWFLKDGEKPKHPFCKNIDEYLTGCAKTCLEQNTFRQTCGKTRAANFVNEGEIKPKTLNKVLAN